MFSVYLLTCTVNGKTYVGITKGSVERRVQKHRSDAQKGAGWVLHASMRKHGVDSFTVETLAIIPDRSTAAEVEKATIIRLNSRVPTGYNVTEGGDGARGYRHTAEWRAEISRRQKGRKMPAESVERMRKALTGRKMSQDAREAMSKRQKGCKHPPSVIAKMRKSALLRWQRSPKVCTPEEAERLRRLALGRKRTPEHIEAIRRAQIGRVRSPEIRERMRQAALLRHARQKAAKKAQGMLTPPVPP